MDGSKGDLRLAWQYQKLNRECGKVYAQVKRFKEKDKRGNITMCLLVSACIGFDLHEYLVAGFGMRRWSIIWFQNCFVADVRTITDFREMAIVHSVC